MDQRGERDLEMTWSTFFWLLSKVFDPVQWQNEISDYFLYFQLESALFSLEHVFPFHNVKSVVDGKNNF